MALFIAVPSFSLAQDTISTPTFIFLRDLRPGDVGEDVRELQKLLNSDPSTQVSLSGNGAPGLETLNFGPATQKAVQKFQNKYANEVLRPAGLAQGSGFVGLWTRLKLNQILLNGAVAETPDIEPDLTDSTSQNPSFVSDISNTGNTLAFFGQNTAENKENEQLSLQFSSHYYGGAGKVVTLSGAGFSSEGNTVVLDGNIDENPKYEVKNVSAIKGSTLKFTIPANIRPGRYDISVSNGRKKSLTLPFMVTTSGATLPVIRKIEPSIAKFDQEIKITGENFTPRGNIVSSGFGTIRDLISEDGTSILFSIPRPDGFQESTSSSRAQFTDGDSQYWPMRIYVYNENGASLNTPSAQFMLDIK